MPFVSCCCKTLLYIDVRQLYRKIVASLKEYRNITIFMAFKMASLEHFMNTSHYYLLPRIHMNTYDIPETKRHSLTVSLKYIVVSSKETSWPGHFLDYKLINYAHTVAAAAVAQCQTLSPGPKPFETIVCIQSAAIGSHAASSTQRQQWHQWTGWNSRILRRRRRRRQWLYRVAWHWSVMIMTVVVVAVIFPRKEETNEPERKSQSPIW